MRVFYSILTLVLFFVCGFFAVRSSMLSSRIFQVTDAPSTRDPAAIKKVYDFSHLDGYELEQATKKRLISGVRFFNEESDIGVELGHFVQKDQEGQKSFACDLFSKIVLVFEGDGSASNGKKPVMEVEGQCQVSQDINAISPLWIPVSRILAEPVADGDFDFREGRQAKVHFMNVVEEWPTIWKLSSVRLSYTHSPNSEVTIDEKELLKFSEKPILINFR